LNENLLDPIKRLSDWALTTGREYQSPQTKFIHYFYGRISTEKADTIPVYDNVLFVLALLRSRSVEAIQEAKQLLRHLLAFQIQTADFYRGSFPIYLHHYPDCQDPTVALRLLAPFYWILKQFGHILGSELKQLLEQAIQLALDFCLKSHLEKPFSYPLAVRLAAAQIAYGRNSLEVLDPLVSQQLTHWHTTSQLSDILVGLQMVFSDLTMSPWQPLWERMAQTWHAATGSYMGPQIREWEVEGEPKPALYDLYCGYFSGQFSTRVEKHEIFQLQAVLIQPTPNRFPVVSEMTESQGDYKQQQWKTFLCPTHAYTLFDKNHLPNPSLDKTWTPFRFAWGNLQKMFSLVCQGGQCEQVSVTQEDQTIQLIFDLNESIPDEISHKERVIEFFVNYAPHVKFTINGQFANTFKFDQVVQLTLGPFKFDMQWKLLVGEGDFFGHWMYGNRPSQIEQEGNHLQAHDWTFFLRSLRRKGHCRIQVLLERKE
jgi:hypothetical protein